MRTTTATRIPRQAPLEIEFCEDERRLLALLQAKAIADGTVPVSDTTLIQQLALPAERFFAAKMRLVAGSSAFLMEVTELGALIRERYPRTAEPACAATESRSYRTSDVSEV
ncbi:MAG TPA: hypothetical protein VH351_15390 [Bryobacteraceae bacterium]|nr:hypothetical protein [Bryobacteraceae bacterium]